MTGFVAALASLLTLAAIAAGCSGSGIAESYTAQEARESNATAGAASSSAAGQASGAPSKPSDFAGVWQGTTLAICGGFTLTPSRCNAEQKVTITLLDDGSKLTGKYRCAYGNMDCYDMNETGKVMEVTLNGARMNVRVQMPDGTSCYFTGLDVDQSLNGGYSCFAGGSQIEQGSWRARRSY